MADKLRNVFTVRFEPEVADALLRLAARNRREPSEQIASLMADALSGAGVLSPAWANWLRRREEVVERFGQAAEDIVQAEGVLRPDIIAETARRLVDDAEWAANYRALIGAELFDKRVATKGRVNPLLGRRARLLLNAEGGAPFAVQQPSIFTTSTRLHPSGWLAGKTRQAGS